MPTYRIYTVDDLGRLRDVEVIEAADDAVAISAANGLQARRGKRAFELWQGGRLVLAYGSTAPER